MMAERSKPATCPICGRSFVIGIHTRLIPAHDGCAGSEQRIPLAAVDIDALPINQTLILEVLAGRWRTGERMWTFSWKPGFQASLKELERLGLVIYKRDTYGNWLVGLTEEAVPLLMPPDSGYVPPSERAERRTGERRRIDLAGIRAALQEVADRPPDRT